MSALGADGAFGRVMIGAAVAGLVAGALAFVPSPFGVLDLFQTVPALEIKAPPPLKLQPVPASEFYDLVTLRPLFNPERRPDPKLAAVAAGSSASAAPTLGDLSQYRLLGLTGDSQIQLALVQKAGGTVMTLKPGDSFDGWTIGRISAAGVAVSGAGRQELLTIPKARNSAVPP